MKVFEIPAHKFADELRRSGLIIRTGPFQLHIKTSIELLARAIHILYADFPVSNDLRFADFHVRVAPPLLRRWYRQQVQFYSDDGSPFNPLPINHAHPMFEWCLNWSITTHANQFLIVHAAIIERQGFAAVLAAPPGFGKSTLTAGLIGKCWRLLSDELTLIRPDDGFCVPLVRPIGLKNNSIDLIRSFVPDSVIGPPALDTQKGTVAYLKPPKESVERMDELALPQWIIFPKFAAGKSASFTPCTKANALLNLADNAFNFNHHGTSGFECLASLIDRCDCYEFHYGNLEEAVAAFDALLPPQAAARR